jgi:CTP synthase
MAARWKSPNGITTATEVNTAYKDRLEKHRLIFSALSPDVLSKIVEYGSHLLLIDVQYYLELKLRLFELHALPAFFLNEAATMSHPV